MGAHEIHHLVREYGTLLVFAAVALQAMGFPVPGTTALAAAALYAASGHSLPITGVIAAGALGALVGTSAGYAVGRWGGEALLLRMGARLRQRPDRVQLLRRKFAEHGAVWLFFARFITGGRNLAGLLAGASAMRLGRFVAVSAAAALVWALVSGLEYYFFGHALLAAGTWLQIALICAGIAWIVVSVSFVRRRTMRQLKAAAAADPR